MNKELLINRIVAILWNAGFIISDRCDIRPRSFDLAARRDELLLLIKVLYNVDGFNEDTAREMQSLSKYLHGNPVIIGEKTRDHSLETGVVYFRYGIPAFNVETMSNYFIEDIPPLIYAEHGGLYVKIEGGTLREQRIQENISLGSLASMLGVSRRTISKYEEGEMAASVDVALKLEEILDRGFAVAVDLFGKIDLSNPRTQVKPEKTEEESSSVFSLLEDIGFDVRPISQAPFDAVSLTTNRRDKDTILIGVGEYTSTVIKKAHLMSSISEVALTQSLLIIHGASKKKNIDKTVLLDEKELEKFNDSDDFMNVLQERKRKIEVS